MKKAFCKLLRGLLCAGLILTLALSNTAAVYAMEEEQADQSTESAAAVETNTEKEAQAVAPEKTIEPAAEEIQEPALEKDQELIPEQTKETAPEQTKETVSEQTKEAVPEQTKETVSEQTKEAAPEQTKETAPEQTKETVSEQISNTDKEASAEEAKADLTKTQESEQLMEGAASTAAGTIHIGETTFNSGENESSGWSDGKGWKNLAGQYVAMVDYKGEETEISMDSGVLTLAVAGVNRIGALKGDCSVNIVGTGIVLIDSLELGAGNTLSLMTNTALYEKGSAAVFLKQEDGSYLLINGETTGILDEDYTLDNVKLIIPKGSSLTLSAAGLRKETWYSDELGDYVTEITRYTTSIPYEDAMPVHENGDVHIEGFASRMTLGKESALTVNEGASVFLKQIAKRNLLNYEYIAANLVIHGVLDVMGLVEGGLVDVRNGGSLSGTQNGTVRSSKVTLSPEGKLSKDLVIENSALIVNAEKNTVRNVSATIKNSAVYLKGNRISVQDLNVSGDSVIGTETADFGRFCKIGNITLSKDSSLKILANDHSYWDSQSMPTRLLEDCFLEIFGNITGGKVQVLAGCVEYTGKQTGVLPIVPSGYASRLLIDGVKAASSEFPLIMTRKEASDRADSDQITVMHLEIWDLLNSENIQAREWKVKSCNPLKSLKREKNQRFTCASFLDAYKLEGSMSDATYCTAVEVIHSDLSRERFWLTDTREFSTEDVIMIRVIDVSGLGGQGGAAMSHTETTYTGSGILGDPGAGTVTAGKSTVVYTNGTPSPIDPDDKPDEKENKPDEKENKPAEKEDKPAEKDSSSKENKNGSEKSQTSNPSENTSTAQNTITEGEVSAVVAEEANGRYTLTAYRNGTELDSMSGSSVTVRVQDPEGVTEDDICYIIFMNDQESKWIPAKYDKETKELVFETDRAGTFGVARVVAEEVKYNEADEDAPKYRKLSIWVGKEEIKDLPDPIKVEVLLKKGEDNGKGLYAVFVDENEKLNVFPVICDESNKNKKKYLFETDVTGYFVVVKLENEYRSDSELYDACKASEEVQTLSTLIRQKAFQN